MARNTRAAQLETRTSRLKLPVSKKPVFVRIGPGLSLGYRRNQTAGTWVTRVADGRGGARTKAIGAADDLTESDGAAVLTFWEAQARAKAAGQSRAVGRLTPALTVQVAADAYLGSLAARNQRTARDARLRMQRLFLPTFGDRLVAELTRSQIERWRDGLVRVTDDAERRRRSQDTANRVLTIVKAMLNHAVSDPANGLSDDHAWRLVKPFQRVARARVVHFEAAGVRRLVAAADDPAFKDLLRAGFLTGARYGELAACLVKHFDGSGSLHVPSGKTGPRTVILQPEAVNLFSRLVDERSGDEPLLARGDGSAWAASHQLRPMKRALAGAGLDPAGTFYALRHSYISRAIEAGVPLNIVADNCGTSVRMIETTYAKMLATKRREFIEHGAPRLSVEEDNTDLQSHEALPRGTHAGT